MIALLSSSHHSTVLKLQITDKIDMAPKLVRAKPITSFFLKPAANLTQVESRKDATEILEAERRFTSSVEQIVESSSSSTRIPVPAKERRIELDAPEFGMESTQVKKSTKVGKFTLTSVEDTVLPVLSIRARERSQKLLSSTKKRNVFTKANVDENLTVSEAASEQLEAEVNFDSAPAIEPDTLPAPLARMSCQRVTKPESGSKRGITFRIAESDSKEGDKGLTQRVVEGVNRLCCEVC